MLFSFSVAPSLGYSSYWDNVGDLYNDGFEFGLNANIFDKKDFRWDMNFNITHVHNKITKLHEDKKNTTYYDLSGNSFDGYVNNGAFVAEGLSMYVPREKEYAGVDPETGKSLWYKNIIETEKQMVDGVEKSVDVWKGTETTDDWSKADYYVTHKSSIPNFYGGLGTNLYFYGFDFSINTSFQLGGWQYDGTYADFMGTPTTSNTGHNIHADVLNAWSPTNRESNIPRWQFGDTYSAGASTRFLTKASYFNIENISFGYTLPSRWTSKIGIQSLRIYAIAQNVWYWSARQGFDPRQGSGNTTTNSTYYSPMRTISGGVTFTF